MYVLDFETEKIVDGSDRSPVPVGVAVKQDDKTSRYYAWGHPGVNNCTHQDGKCVVREIFQNSLHEVIMHNAKFDVRVAVEHFNIEINAKIHDTMIMAFLVYPYEKSLSLKYLAEKYLNIPPQEQADLKEWIIENVKGATEKNFGAFISLAPSKLVGRYACMDVDMTYSLFYALRKEIFEDEK